MSIEIKAMEPRDKERQIAFFTLDGQEFSCGNVPVELDTEAKVLEHLKKREDEFKLLILRKQYPESDHKRFQKDGITELEAMQEWIAKGHKNKVQVGVTATEKPKFVYIIIEKQELRYTHPKSVKLKPLIEKASTIDEIKGIIRKMF